MSADHPRDLDQLNGTNIPMKISWLRSSFALRLLPFGVLVLLGVMWGGVPSIAKYITQQGVPPLSYSFWIVSIASSVLIVFNFLRGAKLPPRHIWFYFVCGVTGTALPTTSMYFSLQWIPASLMALLLAAAPIFTFVIALGFRVEKYHPLKSLGLLFAMVGILLILMPDSINMMNSPVPAILLGLSTPLFYSINIVYTAKRRPENLNVLDLSISMLIAATIVLFFVTIAIEPLYPLWNADTDIALLMLLHGTITAAAFCFFYSLVKHAGALFSSQVTYTVTVFGIIIGAYVHNEVLPFLVWVAAGLMFAGVGFIQRARLLSKEI